MANTFFKSFGANDRTSSRTLLHEFIPITGTLLSGTYNVSGEPERGENIKTFSHGMFQSVYDYPYVSSSANHIFDISYGTSTESMMMGREAQIDFSNNPDNGASITLTSLSGKQTVISFHTDGTALTNQIDADSIAAGGAATAFDNTSAKFYIFRQPTKNRIYINKAHLSATNDTPEKISSTLHQLNYYFSPDANSSATVAIADGSVASVGQYYIYNTSDTFIQQAYVTPTEKSAKREFFIAAPLAAGSDSISIWDASNSSNKVDTSVDTIALLGTHNVSNTPAFTTTTQNQKEKKENMYHQMAQILVGFDQEGKVRSFDEDGDFTGGHLHDECFFLTFSRLLVKDEIKKGSFSMTVGTGLYTEPFDLRGDHSNLVLTDSHVTENSGYKINSPAGEYAILKAVDPITAGLSEPVTRNYGLIFYQAGVVVLSQDILQRFQWGPNISVSPAVSAIAWQIFLSETGYLANGSTDGYAMGLNAAGESILKHGRTSAIDTLADALRHRIMNIQFNNTTELNSTIYFCRANHNEFNYSSNPTYMKDSKLVVKGDNIMNPPRAYVTTVGLYSADNELLAVAKLSEPLRKDPTNELTLRVRLDY